MADDRRRSNTGGGFFTGPERRAGGSGSAEREMAPRATRAPLVLQVRYKYESIIDFVETQSMNVSRTGMFIASADPVAIGTMLDFEITLSDGFCLLKGRAEVARTSQTPRGLGVKFAQLDTGQPEADLPHRRGERAGGAETDRAHGLRTGRLERSAHGERSRYVTA